MLPDLFKSKQKAARTVMKETSWKMSSGRTTGIRNIDQWVGKMLESGDGWDRVTSFIRAVTSTKEREENISLS